ncbi:MAG: sirohydrochlorin cobaltochelatase [Lachnospiraceae bacterium]
MKKTKAILVVSFGTSHLDTLEKTITAIEQKVVKSFPDYAVYRAFTSQMILDKLQREEGLHYYNIKEAMEQMAKDGIETVIAQPTHIINGFEYDKMKSDLMEYAERFQRIRVGKPLLSSVEDYKKTIHALMAEIELRDGEFLVLMGHGTEHHANSAYPSLEYTLHSLGYDRVLVGTVEGFPELRNVKKKLENEEVNKVILMPFMIVAGDHAKNDMAGEEDSWKTELENSGYDVKAVCKGLGEIEGIRNIYIEHIEEVV